MHPKRKNNLDTYSGLFIFKCKCKLCIRYRLLYWYKHTGTGEHDGYKYERKTLVGKSMYNQTFTMHTPKTTKDVSFTEFFCLSYE